MGSLDGKVALVSGAARGQGEAQARRFAAEGAMVLLGDVLDDEGKAVAESIGSSAVYRHLDVTQEADWQEALTDVEARWDGIDVLVNNAGIARFAPLVMTSLEDYMAVIGVNQVGVFLGMKAVVPLMARTGGGSIVNTSSVDGMTGMVGVTAYVASKFAVRGMTKTAALELGASGIRVNSIHPGGVDTPMLHPDGMPQMDLASVFTRVPLKRIGTVDDIAELALFLASDRSAYCTGSESSSTAACWPASASSPSALWAERTSAAGSPAHERSRQPIAPARSAGAILSSRCSSRRGGEVPREVRSATSLGNPPPGARERLLRAARVVLAERGLAARVEDVAEAAGVSRRTVFRHFTSRDALIAAALRDSMRSYGEHLPRHEPGRSLSEWLRDSLVAAHEMNARHGRIYFELALATELEGPLAEVAELRRAARAELVSRFSAAAWDASGASGEAPRWLVDTVAILLSAFATEALVGDFARTPAEAGRVAALVLELAIRAARAEPEGPSADRAEDG